MTVNEFKNAICSMGYTIEETGSRFCITSYKWIIMSVYHGTCGNTVYSHDGPYFSNDHEHGFYYGLTVDPKTMSFDEILEILQKKKVQEKECTKQYRKQKINQL